MGLTSIESNPFVQPSCLTTIYLLSTTYLNDPSEVDTAFSGYLHDDPTFATPTDD